MVRRRPPARCRWSAAERSGPRDNGPQSWTKRAPGTRQFTRKTGPDLGPDFAISELSMLAHALLDNHYPDLEPAVDDIARRPDPFARMRSALVTENINMARRIAAMLARRLPPGLADDVQSAALLGLVEAARRFHPGR